MVVLKDFLTFGCRRLFPHLFVLLNCFFLSFGVLAVLINTHHGDTEARRRKENTEIRRISSAIRQNKYVGYFSGERALNSLFALLLWDIPLIFHAVSAGEISGISVLSSFVSLCLCGESFFYALIYLFCRFIAKSFAGMVVSSIVISSSL